MNAAVMQYRGPQRSPAPPVRPYHFNVSWEGVGQRVKALRKAQQLEQEDLAELAGISQATISRMEVGRSDPKIGDVYKVAIALGTTLADLVTEAGPDADLEALLAVDPELRGVIVRVARALPGMPADQRRILARAIEAFYQEPESGARNRAIRPT
jgi:transcriptional regulator with XRE-family HTH domain